MPCNSWGIQQWQIENSPFLKTSNPSIEMEIAHSASKARFHHNSVNHCCKLAVGCIKTPSWNFALGWLNSHSHRLLIYKQEFTVMFTESLVCCVCLLKVTVTCSFKNMFLYTRSSHQNFKSWNDFQELSQSVLESCCCPMTCKISAYCNNNFVRVKNQSRIRF